MHVRVLAEQIHDAVFVAVVTDELQGDGAAVPLRPEGGHEGPDAHSHDVAQADEAHGFKVRTGEQPGGVGGGDAGAQGGDVLPVHQGLENAGVGLVEQDVAIITERSSPRLMPWRPIIFTMARLPRSQMQGMTL